MADTPQPEQQPEKGPQLANLVEAAKPTRGQKIINFVGLGYGGNTAVSVVAVNIIRKTCGPLIQKWENSKARKFADKAIKKELGESYEKLSAEDKATVDERYMKRGTIYARKIIDGYLLSIGGFVMLPFQSALEIFHYNSNIKSKLDSFRKDAAQHIDKQEKGDKSIGDMAEDWLKEGAPASKETIAEAMLDKQIAEQKAALDPIKDEASIKLLDNAKNAPKFDPLGSAAKQGLPRWIFGRATALVAAYATQSVVESIAGDKKDKVDMVLAKIFTKIFHPGGYTPAPEHQNLFKDLGIEGKIPEGVDPKVLKTVRMFTTDGYMTTAALLTHNAMNEGIKGWEARQKARKAETKAASPAP